MLRCSSTDRLLHCSGSVLEVANPYNPPSAVQAQGNAGHEVLALVATDEAADTDRIAAAHGVDIAELEMLEHKGARVWEEIRRWFGDGRTEQLMEHDFGDFVLRGTTDLIAHDTDGRGPDDGALLSLAVGDWKLGHRDDEHIGQLKSYAVLARERWGMPISGYILATEIWARLGKYQHHKLTAEQLDVHVDAIRSQLKRGHSATPQWGPSDTTCLYCPRQNECAALADYVRSSVVGLAPLKDNRQPVALQLIADNYDAVLAAERRIVRFKELARAYATRAPVVLADGRRLVIVEDESERLIPSKALTWLRDHDATDSELDAAVRITKSGIERVTKGRSAKGKGAANKRRAFRELRESGAITTHTTRELRVTKD